MVYIYRTLHPPSISLRHQQPRDECTTQPKLPPYPKISGVIPFFTCIFQAMKSMTNILKIIHLKQFKTELEIFLNVYFKVHTAAIFPFRKQLDVPSGQSFAFCECAFSQTLQLWCKFHVLQWYQQHHLNLENSSLTKDIW